MKVSIVIPVYNEADQLAACLRAIQSQTVNPYEVIVVDNNSDDGTAEVAVRFPFVRLIKESRQGVVHARNKGFNAAQGEIIGRIDADTIMPADWVESVTATFNNERIDAVSGSAQYYNVTAAALFNAIDLFFRRRLSRQLKNRIYLWGANMAMRRRAWRAVKNDLCADNDMHEDFDLAIHLQERGGLVEFNELLKAQVSSRRIDVSYLDFMRYVLVSPGTYAQHGIKSRWHMYEVVLVCALGYWPARILHRGFDPETSKFSLRQLIMASNATPRVDPTANVA